MPSEVSSWAMLIKTHSELPEAFRDAYNKVIKVCVPFPYTIYAPADKWGLKVTNPKILFVKDSRMIYMEIKENKVITFSFDFSDIYYIESASLLLYSWIKISGISDNLNLTTIIMEYNSVMDYLFKPLINNVRINICNIQSCDSNSEAFKFDFLQSINFKFMNYGRWCLLPGERIYNIVYQPEVYKSLLKFFKKSITETHLGIFTDKEVIFVSDEKDKKNLKQSKYGVIEIFIPIEKIKKLTLNALDNNKDYVTFNIHFSEFTSLKFIYQISKSDELNETVNNFTKLKDNPM